ncbi:MAG: hypothetical protein EON57_02720, partial [Alphaproteobacteria bacterium]
MQTSEFSDLVAGYVDTPSNYAADPEVRTVYDNVLNGGITWKPFATEDALFEAVRAGEVSVGVGQTLPNWLETIKNGQPTKVLGLSSTQAVPCFASDGFLELLKSTPKQPVTLAIGDEGARDNVLAQLGLLGINKADVTFLTKAETSPETPRPDIDCASGVFSGLDYKPLLSVEQRKVLQAASTGLITVAPDADFDFSKFLIADDTAK